MFVAVALLALVVGAVGGFLSVRNVLDGFQTGSILARSERYDRRTQPRYFYLALLLAITTTALLFAV